MKRKSEFSKVLLVQDSALVWFVTIACVILAFICVINGYLGSLPWLTGMIGSAFAAYGVSQACYYNKSKKENEIKLRYIYNDNTTKVDPFGPI